MKNSSGQCCCKPLIFAVLTVGAASLKCGDQLKKGAPVNNASKHTTFETFVEVCTEVEHVTLIYTMQGQHGGRTSRTTWLCNVNLVATVVHAPNGRRDTGIKVCRQDWGELHVPDGRTFHTPHKKIIQTENLTNLRPEPPLLFL